MLWSHATETELTRRILYRLCDRHACPYLRAQVVLQNPVTCTDITFYCVTRTEKMTNKTLS